MVKYWVVCFCMKWITEAWIVRVDSMVATENPKCSR